MKRCLNQGKRGTKDASEIPLQKNGNSNQAEHWKKCFLCLALPLLSRRYVLKKSDSNSVQKTSLAYFSGINCKHCQDSTWPIVDGGSQGEQVWICLNIYHTGRRQGQRTANSKEWVNLSALGFIMVNRESFFFLFLYSKLMV